MYAWGGNTNGTWSPKVTIVGGLGLLGVLMISIWVSFQMSSYVWAHMIWSSLLLWFILSEIFQRTFKYSWVDTLPPNRYQIRKKIKDMAKGK